jgi:hypothetical protein
VTSRNSSRRPSAAACFSAPFGISGRDADADPDEIQRIVDEAVSEVRAERRAKGNANKA